MEQQAQYQVKSYYTPDESMFCSDCGAYLGDEVQAHWYHQRRGWVHSRIFIRILLGNPVARLFVRGEVVCTCGHKEVWRG